MGFLHTSHWSDSCTKEMQPGITYLEQFEVHGRLGGFLAEATEGTVNAILLLSVYGVYIECECNPPLMFRCLIPEL